MPAKQTEPLIRVLGVREGAPGYRRGLGQDVWSRRVVHV